MTEGVGRGVLGPWLRAGARSALFKAPRWPEARPSSIGLLTVLVVGLGVLLQRGTVAGPALFYWQAINSGWLSTVLLLWVCWLVGRGSPQAAGAAVLFGVLLAQQLLISMPLWGVYLALTHWPAASASRSVAWLLWGIPLLVVGWGALAGAWLLCRQTERSGLRATVLLVIVAMAALDLFVPPMPFWYADEPKAKAELADKRLHLTQEVAEAQSGAVIAALNALQPQRPGVVDLYAITFAPYASEDVFAREASMVSDVMRSRFDAQGHVIQLQNHASTASSLPWATRLNLQRAIQRAASLMDRDEDILFIHLTSHGARDGQLATEFWPLDVEPVTPQLLKTWLDDAGIRYRVISVSACFSGSWIAPLSDPGTLVMTAADAEHTSYGCGSRSELTFFGRAMYDEQLRSSTHSFEAAHAAARQLIDQREREVGKSDGYSNPQISVGSAVRLPLAALQVRLDSAAVGAR